MAEPEQIITPEQLSEKWESEALQNARPLVSTFLEQPSPNVKNELLTRRVLELLDQRNKQREKIFKLAKGYCWTSLAFLIGIVLAQFIARVFTQKHDFSIFNGNELQILVVGVFGQFVGLLYIITKALYDDSNYKEIFSNILGK